MTNNSTILRLNWRVHHNVGHTVISLQLPLVLIPIQKIQDPVLSCFFALSYIYNFTCYILGRLEASNEDPCDPCYMKQSKRLKSLDPLSILIFQISVPRCFLLPVSSLYLDLFITVINK